MKTTRSRRLLRRAQERLPGGVNSPVRAFGAVGGNARFVKRASGARIVDVDGNDYVDWVCSWGAVIAGHAHPRIVDAVRGAAAHGTSFGAPTEAEVELAERIGEWVPSVEMLRLVSSGTEATMSAVRVARGATGRERLVKFEGGYHGHADALLAAAGSGIATLGLPGSSGVPRGAVADTIVLPYNDLGIVEETFSRQGDRIAAVLVEPIAANMGLVMPQPEFLPGLRQLCDAFGTALIFDEVITGFRVARGGAQGHFGVVPDLTTFGKVIGGGLPVGAYGGRRELMKHVAPEGEVYQAGTLSGNPLATAAGLAVLDLLGAGEAFAELGRVTGRLESGFAELAHEAGVPLTTSALGGLWGFFFHPGPVRSYEDAKKADTRRFRDFFQSMLEHGIWLAPSPFEAAFATLAHGDAEVDATLEAARHALRKAL